MEETNPSEVDTFKTNMSKVMKDLLGRFKDLQFFTGKALNHMCSVIKSNSECFVPTPTGSQMDVDGMVALMEYRDINGESRPVMMFFKHGLVAEKF